MATYNKFQDFVLQLGQGVHQLQAAGHTLRLYLTNATPDAALDSVKADLAEITNENGYAAPIDIQNDYTETGGIASLTAVDISITASGGTIGPFRYFVIYNDDVTGDPLVCWWDYGSSVTMQDGEDFDIDFSTSVFTMT